ncbi:hypothetical protein IC229_21785 [Spirosoma sp. BT702]|uniref:MBL fold metallo-hydrolase n=1 Tax=Spirosoma profusum TaxID=2771354 RepID=A0A926Y2Q0_9BACT|nr:hypothetical protein [Spirosoma profusum]MBD2703292.1 hypothetical protein [Spirosoma profusum]
MALDATVIQQGFGFATYPSVFLKAEKTDEKTGKKKFTWVKHLLFGDRLELERANGAPQFQVFGGKKYVQIRGRGASGYVLPDEIQPNRILEVNFIDVGQGDGCHIVTPGDEHFLVDAGAGDNMYRFLKWRFNLKGASKSPPPFTVVVSHSDEDHYAGFGAIFTPANDTRQRFSIDKVYHNGLVEMSGESAETLGTLVTDRGVKYITDLCDDEAAFQVRANGPGTVGKYIRTLRKTSASKIGLWRGSPSIYNQDGLQIEVLGPVRQTINGKAALPVFSNKGKTKNGHSVILKLTFGKVRMLLGGDLNEPAEDYLLQHYSSTDVAALRLQLSNQNLTDAQKQAIRQQITDAIGRARAVFEVEVAKSCHHGSADFTSEFMRAINPLATVISSGDDEPHVHPRPDTLGTIGKHSRGERSLIFSTELARSSKEFVEIANRNSDQAKERTVTVYGMINVRTDGEKLIIAQKLEQEATRGSWDIHELIWNRNTGEFEYPF